MQFLFTEITCQRPQIYDSHLSVIPLKESYSYDEVITFSCSDGYNLIGSKLTTCGNSGHFQGTLPKCAGYIHVHLNLFVYD